MQHFLAQEIEANHRRRELERQFQARGMADLAGSGRGQMSEPRWRRWSNARWRALIALRFGIAPLLPSHMVMAGRDT